MKRFMLLAVVASAFAVGGADYPLIAFRLTDSPVRDPEFFKFYRSMQAYEQGLKSDNTRLVISPDSEFFKYFQSPNGRPSPPAAPAPRP